MTDVLETDRLVLRHLTLDDLDDLARIYADPEVRRFFPEGTLSRDETAEEIAWMLEVDYPRYGYGLWATVLKEDGRFIGRCGLLPWAVVPTDRAELGLEAPDERHDPTGAMEVEIAYLLAQTHWGRGLASEAVVAIVDHGFLHHAVPRLIALIDEDNIASRRVAERAGFRPDGTVEEGGEVFPLHALPRARWNGARG